MDVRCPLCGEPWDTYEFHDVPGLTYGEAWRKFKQIGCAVFDAKCSRELPPEQREEIQTVLDLASYPDDAAADMEDFGLI